MAIAVLLVSAISSSFIIHQFVKNVGIDRYPLTVLGCLIAGYWLVALGLQRTSHTYGSFWAAQQVAFLAITSAVVSLFINILVYRAFFHPLNAFPGPFGAKLSKFWSLRQVVKSDVKWYQVVSKLKEEYGDYVRTVGPRELMIFDTAALNPLLGTRTMKGPFYGSMEKSLHTNQDNEFHKQRRRIWDMAFKQTLTDYGPSIEEFTDKLLVRIDTIVDNAVIVNELCIHYSYDIMSALAFGSSTQFIEGNSSETANTILANIQEGILAIGYLLHIPWMLSVAETLSFVGPMKMFKDWSSEQVEKRRHMKNTRPDIMGHLLEHTSNDTDGRALLDAESRVIIGAGSDTTGSSLAVIFTLLAHYQDYQDKLRTEVRQSFADGTYTCARPQDHLDAFINETLRLCPPILFYSQRFPPKGGLRVGGVEIPEGTVCCIGTYQLHHDERNFPQPNDFIPERWTSRPELITNKAAFIPFSMGPYKCPGKAVAMMELRSVIAKALNRYDISFPEGTNFVFQEYLDNIKDHFTAGVPKQKVVFRLRK
ncbi:cytochrome P450 monooxygenase-like protein [Bisporella sp. PMI_857]|nr:cytochrome P450 monooxygenase-like protein [Bisporella sp. PMI_857]